MCGIAGLVGPGQADVAALERMATTMVHRGPDGQGIWCENDVGFAFRRLAIIDLHERSNQPLHLDDLHLVFNGEIYNYIELRDELRGRGHRFVTEGDAEVLLHAWAEWGESALERLNGMFAFAVWDKRSRRLSMAVDRFAEKPLFFHEAGRNLMFASDVRALRAARRSVGQPDDGATAAFLAFGKLPALPATFFADVSRLPPAHIAHWTYEGGLSIRRWWDPKIVEIPRDLEAAARQLRELLREAVALRLRSDVPVGTSLSGGVDSSTVVGIVSEVAGNQGRHAFTATFPGFERDEWSYAEAAASAAGVDLHHAVRPQIAELLADLETLVADQEEPFGSTSIYAQWRVMRAAREAGVVVLLDGQGADELFGGYPGIEGLALRSQGARKALAAALRNGHRAQQVGRAYAYGRTPHTAARLLNLRQASPYVGRDTAQSAVNVIDAPADWVSEGSPIKARAIAADISHRPPTALPVRRPRQHGLRCRGPPPFS